MLPSRNSCSSSWLVLACLYRSRLIDTFNLSSKQPITSSTLTNRNLRLLSCKCCHCNGYSEFPISSSFIVWRLALRLHMTFPAPLPCLGLQVRSSRTVQEPHLAFVGLGFGNQTLAVECTRRPRTCKDCKVNRGLRRLRLERLSYRACKGAVS